MVCHMCLTILDGQLRKNRKWCKRCRPWAHGQSPLPIRVWFPFG